MDLCFAPMDGITTCSTRWITQSIFEKKGEKSDTLQLWTEFMNIDGFLINPKKVCKHMMTTKEQKPILQIYGGNEQTLLQWIQKLDQNFFSLFKWIELNTWCPSNSVMKVWWGSELMKDKKKTIEIIKTLSENLHHLPFSVKTRAWLNEQDKENQLQFIQEISPYCSKITIHGRTLKQWYRGESDWDFIQKAKNLISHTWCALIGNWWIDSYQDAEMKYQQYQLDGIMIGQNAIGNPRIFCKDQPIFEEKMETILLHFDAMVACEQYFQEEIEKGDDDFLERVCIPDWWIEERIQKNHKKSEFQPHSVVDFRKFLFQYIKGIPWSKEWKIEILSLNGYFALRDEIQRFRDRTISSL